MKLCLLTAVKRLLPGLLVGWCISAWGAQPLHTSYSYQVSVKHITTEQGLPQRSVLSMGQDPQGFVWLGTPTEAYRFNGKTFIAPTMPASARKSYNPGICGLATDHAGNFWLFACQVGDGNYKYVIKPGETQPQPVHAVFAHSTWMQKDPLIEFAPSGDNICRYFRTRSGKVLYQTPKGVFRTVFQHPDLEYSWSPGHRLFQTTEQTLLITLVPKTADHPRTLIEVDSTGRILNRYRLLSNYTLLPVARMADGTIYLHHLFDRVGVTANEVPNPRQALYILRPDKTIVPVSLGLPPSVLLANTYINYDQLHGLFWITGPQLLVAWHPEQGIVFDLKASGFPIARTQQLQWTFVDQTGVVWANCVNGFLMLTLEVSHFQRYLHVDEDQPVASSRQAIRGMTQVGKRLWVNAPTCQFVDLQTGKSQPAVSPDDVHPIFTLSLCPLVRTADGAIWTFFGGALRYDPQTEKAAAYPLGLPNNRCVSAWPDRQGNILLGLEQGLLTFDTRRNRILPFTKYNQFTELMQQRVTGFYPDRPAKQGGGPSTGQGGVWLTSSSGLYTLDPVRGITARYSTQSAAPRKLPFDHISFIYPDPDHRTVYWLATLGGGLIRWNQAEGTWQQFTNENGLSDNTLYAVYEDKYGRLWLPSNHGLMSFHRKTHQIQIYHTKDGIADEEFNLQAHYRAPDGRLFLGGLNGITAFYPDQVHDEHHTLARLLVAGYEKLNPETGQMVNHLAEYELKKEVHLMASDRLFKLSFALLDYRHLGQTRLWYRIGNWQEKWVMHTGDELSLNGLPSGSYALEVRAQTANGDWASPVIRVPIVVDKPVYLRGWFLLLCCILLSALVMAVFRWRNKQLIAETQRLETEVARRTAQIEYDKTVIERQAQDLQTSAVLKSRFFANVTHEFKTPLTLLLGPLQYLSGRINDLTTKELVMSMDRNARQLLTLVNDLLDLSRLDVHELKLTEQPADAQVVLSQVVMSFMAQARHSGIRLSVAGNETPYPMLLDVSKFETVLRNLLANALRHTAMGGYVHVRLEKTAEDIRIAVLDNGSGIHPDDLPHIFDRYFQSNQPGKPLQGGTGIGLALCLEYCRLWGGQLTVDSLPGQGSTFTVTYPVRTFEAAVEPAVPVKPVRLPLDVAPSEQNRIAVKPETGLTLMLVDDNADMLLYARTILSPYYYLQCAANGKQALDALSQLTKEQLPDLIISDIMMPEIDGLTLISELRTNADLRHIPVILLTARTDLESRLQALRLGVADYLTKPFYEAELLTRVQNLLRRSEEKAGWLQEVVIEDTEAAAGEQATWIQWLQQTVRKNLSNQFFNIKLLADMANVSERQLNRRVRALTGFSPGQFIQEVRLQVAYDLFEKQPGILVKEVSMQVGYQKVSYFSQLYRERFGVNPEEHVQLIKAELT